MRKKAEECHSSHDPFLPSIIYQLCQHVLRLTFITACRPISGLTDPILYGTWGKLVPLYLTACCLLPPMPLVNLSPLSRNLTPPALLFIQSFQGHIPPILTLYQGETASKGIPQISVLYPPLLHLTQTCSAAFLPVVPSLLFPSHQQVMCTFRDLITGGTLASPCLRSTPMSTTTEKT